jgi:translation initiation factor IF-3
MFRGREMAHPELGKRILDHVAEEVVHLARVEVFPKLDGRNMIMVLAPDKKAQAAHAKALEEAEQEAAAAQEEARVDTGGAAPAAEVSPNGDAAPGVAPATPAPEATTASTEAEAEGSTDTREVEAPEADTEAEATASTEA